MATLALFSIAGCGMSSNSLNWLNVEHQQAIAEDLAEALSERWDANDARLVVGEVPLKDPIESALRSRGFAVTPETDSDSDALLVSGMAERVPPNTWHIGLNVGDNGQLHRLYAIERNNVEARSAVSFSAEPKRVEGPPKRPWWRIERRPVSVPTTPIPDQGGRWQLYEEPKTQPLRTDRMRSTLIRRPVKSDPTTNNLQEESRTVDTERKASSAIAPSQVDDNESEITALDGLVHARPPSAVRLSSQTPLTNSSLDDQCDARFTAGSLKQNIQRMLDSCGYHLAGWPLDPESPGQELDWVLDESDALRIANVSTRFRVVLAGIASSLGLRLRIDGRAVSLELAD